MIQARMLPLAILSLLMLLIATPALSDGEYTKEFDVESGKTLEIDLDQGGSVSVEGWDKSLVRVTCWENHGHLDRFDVRIEKNRGGVEVSADWKDKDYNSCSLQFEIKVPKQFDVEFKSAGGGFELLGVEGEFRGRTGGGALTFEEAKGEVRMNTGGGKITVLDSELDGKLTTGGGGVLMRNVVGDLRASSGGGNVVYENVRTTDGELRGPRGLETDGMSEETVLITTAGGGIKVKEAPAGASVQTGGGEISVRGARLFVNARTGGGDIEVEVEDGNVTASTGAGDIDVLIAKSAGDEEEAAVLLSGLGHITLTIPEDLSIEFDLDLAYTKNSRKNFEIRGDFEIDEERTKEWDYGHGTPQKHIYGTGKIGDGRHVIRIRTTNGHITIKKGD